MQDNKCGFIYCTNKAETANEAVFPDGKAVKFLLCEYHAMAAYRWYPNHVLEFLNDKVLIPVE